jgi:hypothetical protein
VKDFSIVDIEDTERGRRTAAFMGLTRENYWSRSAGRTATARGAGWEIKPPWAGGSFITRYGALFMSRVRASGWQDGGGGSNASTEVGDCR